MGTRGGSRIDDSTEIVAGMMIGEYRVEGELGAGGMGRVYSAIHPVIAKRAAIKVLHPELSVNREAVERFIQEARAVNQIGHPNIVDIFAFGTLPDGRSYFVMEWLRGESLRDRLKAQRPSLADALMMLETITVALEAAHEKGIVHRDLKPDNVFLVEVKGDRPQVKLLDFGIAKLTNNDSTLSQRTQTGNMMGTPAYMSPEQARGYAVDHRTDVYALGALAFEVMTGSLVFPADNAADMIAKHLHAEPQRARTLNPDIPPPLDELLSRLLAKEAAERPSLAEARECMRVTRQQVAMQMMTGQPPAYDGAVTSSDVGLASHIQRMHPGIVTPVPPYMRTPVPGSAMLASPIGTMTTLPPAQPRSRVGVIVIGVVAAVALGIGVFFVVGRGTSTPTAAPLTPVVTPPVVVTPPTERPIDKPPEKPIDKPPEKPIEKPIETPTVATPTATVKKPVPRLPRPVQKPKPKPLDDDAPM